MKVAIELALTLCLSLLCHARPASQDISPAQLRTVIDLPPAQAVKRREMYKVPLKSAYDRQIANIGKDCLAESKQGQQPYNICIGDANKQAADDLAILYDNLQMLCHNIAELTALQSVHKAWMTYENSAMEAAHAAWPTGSGAPAFAGEVYLSLVRAHMRQLNEIYGLNISQ